MDSSQKTTSHNPRSTVGTVTEIYDYMRLLFARLGHPHCPICGREISHQTLDQIVDQAMNLIEKTVKIDKKAFLEPYFDPETYSTTFSFPLIKAFKKGLRVKSVEVPFSYPMIQKDNEEKGARELFEEKRRTQRVGFLVELLYVIHYLNNR